MGKLLIFHRLLVFYHETLRLFNSDVLKVMELYKIQKETSYYVTTWCRSRRYIQDTEQH